MLDEAELAGQELLAELAVREKQAHARMRLLAAPCDRLDSTVAGQADAARKLPPNRGMIRQKLTGLSITNCKAGVTNAVVLAVSREQHAVISAFKTSMFTVRSFLIRHACPRHTSEFENQRLQALRQA